MTVKMPLNQSLYIDSWIHGLNMIGSFQEPCPISKRSQKLILCVPNTKLTNSQKKLNLCTELYLIGHAIINEFTSLSVSPLNKPN